MANNDYNNNTTDDMEGLTNEDLNDTGEKGGQSSDMQDDEDERDESQDR